MLSKGDKRQKGYNNYVEIIADIKEIRSKMTQLSKKIETIFGG